LRGGKVRVELHDFTQRCDQQPPTSTSQTDDLRNRKPEIAEQPHKNKTHPL
jgi:hypothetical protein